MILGLSHVALNCTNIDAATRRLAEMGYSVRFDEPCLPNHEAKSPFLFRYQSTHHVRALSAHGAMAIELLNHGEQVGAQCAGIIGIFRSPRPCGNWESYPLSDLPISDVGLAAIEDAISCNLLAFWDPDLSSTLLWIPTANAPVGLFACALPTFRPESLKSLLSELRFRPDTTGVWSLLTPLPSLQARVIPVPARSQLTWSTNQQLDSPGCTCIALMSRNSKPDSLPTGLRAATLHFGLRVNGSDYRVSLASHEYGRFFEFVEQAP